MDRATAARVGHRNISTGFFGDIAILFGEKRSKSLKMLVYPARIEPCIRMLSHTVGPLTPGETPLQNRYLKR